MSKKLHAPMLCMWIVLHELLSSKSMNVHALDDEFVCCLHFFDYTMSMIDAIVRRLNVRVGASDF